MQYSQTKFENLRGEELRRANDEYFGYDGGPPGRGPRAAFEARQERDCEFRRMISDGGSLADLSLVFAMIVNAHAAARKRVHY